MNVSSLTEGAVECHELWPLEAEGFGATLAVGAEVVLGQDSAGGAMIQVGGQTILVRGCRGVGERRLAELLDRDLPRLAWVAQLHGDAPNVRAILLQVHQFQREISEPEDFVLHVDEEFLDANRKRIGSSDVASFERWMGERVLLPPDPRSGRDRVLLSAGGGSGGRRGFRIIGQFDVLDVEWRPVAGDGVGSGARFLRRIGSPSRNQVSQSFTLLSGRVVVRDATRASATPELRSELDLLVQSSASYLGLWERYNRLERGVIERVARDFGVWPYKGASPKADGSFRFGGLAESGDLASRFEELIDDEIEIQVTEEKPDSEGEFTGSSFTGSVVDAGRGFVILKPRRDGDFQPPPNNGFISVSTFGDRRRLDRRERAKDRIATACCGIPWLGKIIEGADHRIVRRRRVEPWSASSLAAFGGTPTAAQREALDIALNTPDIAIIQGPPGTGKTRVIAALQARLAELGEHDDGPWGQTLLTSFQHDAVDNVAAASEAFGLPAFRVGGRRTDLQVDDSVERWRRELIEKLRASVASQPTTPVHVLRRRLRDRMCAASVQPLGAGGNARLLEEIRADCAEWLDSNVSERIDRTIRMLRSDRVTPELPIALEQVTRAVAALPTTDESARDDGPRRAAKALRLLRPIKALSDFEEAILARIAEWDGEGDTPSLTMIAELREAILARLRPQLQIDDRLRPNDQVDEVLTDVLRLLDAAARSAPLDASVAVEELIDELESDPDAVREEIERYATTLAATVQQSVGGQMRDIKLPNNASWEETWPTFRNVVVDEAARCNPLDLMIPLSIADRRIILVGDHRQLPHVLEPDLERELVASGSDATKTALSTSLFETLQRNVLELESRDGVRRYVRLDQQFRMHPALGEFVSQSFYASHSESFASPRPASEFAHSLGGDYDGVVAAWKDIPYGSGGELSGRSKRRPAEASWIADEVSRIGLEDRSLSIGVITFYAAQVTEICKSLVKVGVLDEGEDGWQPTDQWRFTSKGAIRNRIRVGTVDAFQGMEFDVVFLSTVRSNLVRVSPPEELPRKFGFLLLPNRVCVAMSRQQRLLIAVGDHAMFTMPEASGLPGVSALSSFWELCGRSHGRRF